VTVQSVRAWALTLFGCASIIYGMVNADAPSLMTGFAVLGAEPTTRAAVTNGVQRAT
jgi:hypothetical protein